MDLASLLERAVAEGAVLWLSLSQNDYVCSGIQELLEELRIPFTGTPFFSGSMLDMSPSLFLVVHFDRSLRPMQRTR